MEKKTRLLFASVLIIGIANLAMVIYQYYDSRKVAPSLLTPKAIVKIKGTETGFNDLRGISEKYRDTLEDIFKGDFNKVYTGGVRFTFAEVKLYIEYLTAKLVLDQIPPEQMYLYLCPGMYTKETADTNHPENRMTCILLLSKTKDIFKGKNGMLSLPRDQFYGAYNWGSLEP